MSANKKHVTTEQKNIMLEFFESHPELKSGKFTNSFTFKQAQALWVTLTASLNAAPGARKEWKQWRKTWQDFKGATKKKNSLLNREMVQTGGGPPTNPPLTEEEVAVIQMIGVAATEGHPNILESDVTFIDVKNNDPMRVEKKSPEEENTPPNDPIQEKTKKRKKNTQTQRLDNTIQATKTLASQNQLKIEKREIYWDKKIKLYEKDVDAKIRIAAALEAIANKMQ